MGSSTRPHSDETASTTTYGVSRRTVARTTAWATPVLLTSIGAPAFAGTDACVDRGTASLGCGPDGGGGGHHHHHDGATASGHDDDDDSCTVSTLTFGSSAITATVSITATDAHGDTIDKADDTGVVRQTDFTPSWSYINLHHPEGMSQGDTLTMTITLSQPVSNFTLRITDIDKDPGSWIDEVFVGPRGYGFTAGSTVGGTGTPADPFIATTDGRIDETSHPDSGDVTLLWSGPVQQVTISYVAADSENDSGLGQHIGVGQIGFDNCG